jgi:N6-L-threonylcarbamoyladenine synthase
MIGMYILGIESSCDETALGLIHPLDQKVFHVVYSQIQEHQSFGGVVPEQAARTHLEKMSFLLQRLLSESGVAMDCIQAIGVTSGPGLMGSLLMGVCFAKGLALSWDIPLLGVHHLEAHGLTMRFVENFPSLIKPPQHAFLLHGNHVSAMSQEDGDFFENQGETTDPGGTADQKSWPYASLEFPFLMFLISGGHCQFVIAHELGRYETLGQTLDDAPGECLDKIARLLGLPYPGGPHIERLAQQGNPDAFSFPNPLYRQKDCNFSFSGLKTAGRLEIEKRKKNKVMGGPCQEDSFPLADFCASFQKAIADHLCRRLEYALEKTRTILRKDFFCTMGGGVTANRYILGRLQEIGQKMSVPLVCPPPFLCGDNGLMVAWTAYEYIRAGRTDCAISIPVRPRWPL